MMLNAKNEDEKKIDWEDNADDSSDEETIDSCLSDYNAYDKLLEYCQENNHSSQDEWLSFLVHALALSLLYSKETQANYYLSKRKLLSGSKHGLSEEEFNQVLEQAIYNVTKIALANHEAASLFFKKQNELIRTIAKYISQHKEYLFSALRHNKWKDSLLNKKITPFIKDLFIAISTFVDQEKFVVNSVFFITARTLASSNSIGVLSIFEQEKESIIKSLSQYELMDKASGRSPEKAKRKKIVERLSEGSLSSMPTIDAELRKLLVGDKDANGNEKRKPINGNKKIANVLDELYSLIAETKIIELLMAEANRADSPLRKGESHHYLRHPDPALMEYSIIGDLKNIQDKRLRKILLESTKLAQRRSIIQTPLALKVKEEHFFSTFWEELLIHKSIFSWDRTTLPEQFSISVRDSYELLATVRLFNRSQTRLRRQKEQENIGEGEEVVNRGVLFSTTNHVAVEKQTVTKKGVRTDLVLNLPSYSKIATDLADLLTHINTYNQSRNIQILGDSDIVHMIRNILRGRKEALSYVDDTALELDSARRKMLLKFLSNLVYLFFVTEVARNPASLIINQMILDLIFNKVLSWQEVLTGKFDVIFPMAMTDAVGKARHLNKLYKDYMPYPYEYSGDIDKNYKVLIAKEAQVILLWLNIFYPKLAILKQNNDIDINVNNLPDIINSIKGRIPLWFFVELNKTEEKTFVSIRNFSASFSELSLKDEKRPTYEESDSYDRKINLTSKEIVGKNASIQYKFKQIFNNGIDEKIRSGSCGFIALGIAREKFLENMLENHDNIVLKARISQQIKNDFEGGDLELNNKAIFEQIKNLFRKLNKAKEERNLVVKQHCQLLGQSSLNENEIRQAYIAKGHPIPDEKKLTQAQARLQDAENELDEYLQSSEVTLTFLKAHVLEQWLGTYIMLAYAEVNKLALRIWKEKDDSLELFLSFPPLTDKTDLVYLDIAYVNESHYERLELINQQSLKLSTLPFKFFPPEQQNSQHSLEVKRRVSV